MTSSKKNVTESADSELEGLTFEGAVAEIEKIVRAMEQGQLGLDQTLAEYERAVKRIRFCHQQLEQAERKIEILRSVDKDGKATSEPFGDEAETLEQKQASRTRRRSHSTDL